MHWWEMKDENMPCFMDFGYEKGGKMLFKIHREYLEYMLEYASRSKTLFKEPVPELACFIPPSENKWGYGKVFCREENEGDMTIYAMDLAAVPQHRNQTKKDLQWKAVSASISVLFNTVWLFEESVHSNLRQLIVIDQLDFDGGFNGYALSVNTSLHFSQWLARQKKERPIPEASENMAEAYSLVTGRKCSRGADNRPYIGITGRDGIYLCSQTVGCDLGTDGSDLDKSGGKGLVPHNIDGPADQLSMLAALFTLCQMARRDGF